MTFIFVLFSAACLWMSYRTPSITLAIAFIIAAIAFDFLALGAWSTSKGLRERRETAEKIAKATIDSLERSALNNQEAQKGE